MKLRTYYLKHQASFSDTDKIIENLKGAGLLSAIEIEIQATNGSTSCTDHEIHDDVTKIEVVDGAEVLESLRMIEWRGLNFYELGKMPRATFDENGGATQKESIMILFGRYLGDPEYYFDPSKFNNPQLIIDVALTISATVGFATGTGKVTIKLYIIEEGALPQKGFLMRKEKYNFSTASSGDEYIDLPVDFPYAAIGFSSILTTYRPDEAISQVKLTFDDDEYVPVNIYTEDIMDRLRMMYGLAEQKKRVLTADDGTVLTDIYDIHDARIFTEADDHIATVEAIDAEKVSNGLYDLTTVGTPALQTTAKACNIYAKGLCPHGMVIVTPQWVSDFGNLLEVAGRRKLQLILTQAQSGAAVRVVISQVRS